MTGVATLRHSTFSVLLETVSLPVNREVARWCPKCLQGEDAHWQLVWKLPLYSACILHDVDIESRCSLCGSEQRAAKPLHRQMKCSSCGSALAHQGVSRRRSAVHRWANQVQFELVEWIATPGVAENIPSDNFQIFISTLVQRDFYSNRFPPLIKKFLHNYVVRSVMPKPSLGTLLNLAALQAVHPLDILLRPSEAAELPLFDLSSAFKWMPFGNPHDRSACSSAALCLTSMLRHECSFLPPINQVLRQLDVRPCTLSERFPDVALAYGKARRSKVPCHMRRPISRAFSAGLRKVGQVEIDPSWCHSPPGDLARDVSDLVDVAFDVAQAGVQAAAIVLTHCGPSESELHGPIDEALAERWLLGA